MNNKIKDYFEKVVLKGTCFDSLEDLQKDKTLVDVNAPRALIACNLMGVWKGLNLAREISLKDLRHKLTEEIIKDDSIFVPMSNRQIAVTLINLVWNRIIKEAK